MMVTGDGDGMGQFGLVQVSPPGLPYEKWSGLVYKMRLSMKIRYFCGWVGGGCFGLARSSRVRTGRIDGFIHGLKF